MRLIGHDAADTDGAGVRIGGKRIDDGLRLRDRFRRWREHLVDDRHLRRVNGHFCRKAVAARGLAFAAEAFAVAEVDIDGVDRRHVGGGRAGEAKRARQPVGIEETAVRIAVGLGAELGGKILGAPGQRAAAACCAPA